MNLKYAASLFVTAAMFGVAHADISVGNYGSWDGSTTLGNLGSYYETNAYGEVFTAPTGAIDLTEFSSTLYGTYGSSFNLDFVIAAWNGSQAVGPVLAEFDNIATPAYGFEDYEFFTSVAVTPGEQYVAFWSNLGVDNADQYGYIEEAWIGGPESTDHYNQWYDDYAETNDPTVVFNNPWNGNFISGDWVYNATFSGTSSTPSPAAAIPFVLGLISRRRRRA